MTGIGQVGDPTKWGNGAATARVFAHQGAKIFGCDLDLVAAEHTASRLRSEFKSADITVVQADVTKDIEVKILVNACVAKYGRVHVLVK